MTTAKIMPAGNLAQNSFTRMDSHRKISGKLKLSIRPLAPSYMVAVRQLPHRQSQISRLRVWRAGSHLVIHFRETARTVLGR